MQREFLITPKITNNVLQGIDWRKHRELKRFARVIWKNNDEVWPEWISEGEESIRFTSSGFNKRTAYTGIEALARYKTATIGSIAARAGWDMHSAQVVFMGGFSTLALMQNSENRELFKEALFNYTDQCLPNSELYANVLQSLLKPLSTDHSDNKNYRERILNSLKLNDIEGALLVLTSRGFSDFVSSFDTKLG